MMVVDNDMITHSCSAWCGRKLRLVTFIMSTLGSFLVSSGPRAVFSWPVVQEGHGDPSEQAWGPPWARYIYPLAQNFPILELNNKR